MIKKKTVLILGAGASMAYGYPSGRVLKDRICENFTTNKFELLKQVGIDVLRLRDFKDQFPYSGQSSIDSFLEYQPKLAEAGKAAIAQVLLECENFELLFQNDPSKNWYEYLFAKMTDDGPERFAENQLKVITFNYDNSLESFFYWALQNSYGIQPQNVCGVMKEIEIVHVHGMLTNIPWLSFSSRKYGDPQKDSAGIPLAARQLSIIHDDIEKSGVLEKVKSILDWAEVIIFLGFGYHPLNMERLSISKEEGGPTIKGTTKGLTELERGQIQNKYPPKMFQNIEWTAPPEHDIIGFFRNCWQLDVG